MYAENDKRACYLRWAKIIILKHTAYSNTAQNTAADVLKCAENATTENA